MKLLLALSLVALAVGSGVATDTAQAHFLYHHKHLSLDRKVNYFERSIDHDRSALIWLYRVRGNLRKNLRALAARHDFAQNVYREIVFHKHALRWHTKLAYQYRLKYEASLSPEEAICYVFGPDCGAAKSVSWCESKFHTWATNGQYLGLFQMGSGERAHYGHGSTPIAQVRAAYLYYLDSGWSPWECQP